LHESYDYLVRNGGAAEEKVLRHYLTNDQNERWNLPSRSRVIMAIAWKDDIIRLSYCFGTKYAGDG